MGLLVHRVLVAQRHGGSQGCGGIVKGGVNTLLQRFGTQIGPVAKGDGVRVFGLRCFAAVGQQKQAPGGVICGFVAVEEFGGFDAGGTGRKLKAVTLTFVNTFWNMTTL